MSESLGAAWGASDPFRRAHRGGTRVALRDGGAGAGFAGLRTTGPLARGHWVIRRTPRREFPEKTYSVFLRYYVVTADGRSRA